MNAPSLEESDSQRLHSKRSDGARLCSCSFLGTVKEATKIESHTPNRPRSCLAQPGPHQARRGPRLTPSPNPTLGLRREASCAAKVHRSRAQASPPHRHHRARGEHSGHSICHRGSSWAGPHPRVHRGFLERAFPPWGEEESSFLTTSPHPRSCPGWWPPDGAPALPPSPQQRPGPCTSGAT